MRDISDEQLMIMYKDGNIAAFDLLFEKYHAPVFNFIYRMLNRQRHSAEDLLQEIFMKVDLAKNTYEIKARFSTWLFTITRNHCLNFLKSKLYEQAVRTVSLDTHVGENKFIPGDKPAANRSGPDAVEQKEFQEMFEEIISTLPGKYREIFLLHAVEGFTHQEIAEMLNANPATVRTDYHRAKLIIKDRLQPILDRNKED